MIRLQGLSHKAGFNLFHKGKGEMFIFFCFIILSAFMDNGYIHVYVNEYTHIDYESTPIHCDIVNIFTEYLYVIYKYIKLLKLGILHIYLRVCKTLWWFE